MRLGAEAPVACDRSGKRSPVATTTLEHGAPGAAASAPNDKTLVAEKAASVAGPETDRKVEELIDQLVNVSEPGFGYSALFSGSEFVPYDEPGEIGTLVLGGGY